MDRFKFRARWKDTGKVIDNFMQEYTLSHLDDEDILVEQCSGRVDRDNKLIYENDLVQDAMGDVCLVSFCNDDCSFTLERKHDCFIFDSDVYIIGNIHQNKELLD